jgi:hypothetical protein
MAANLVEQFHYSQVMPRITKAAYGWFDGEKLVGALTLGWGVRPVHTIAKAFPGLGTADYFEIGKMCLRDELPRNSESQFLSQVIAAMRSDFPAVKLLYTWADGILGKPGYVYQAANFFYGGFITTEIYLNADGVKVHARTMQGISTVSGAGTMNSRAGEVTRAMGYQKYWGKQFRYVYPLCGKREWKDLQAGSPFPWERGHYPKDVDCTWGVDTDTGRKECAMPPFTRGAYVKLKQPSLFGGAAGE